MEILAILGVKNSNVCLNNNKNAVPSFAGCAGTCELNCRPGSLRSDFQWPCAKRHGKVSLMVFNERKS